MSRATRLPVRQEHKPVHLTPREAQIVELLHQGLSNKEMASDLGISDATVKRHLGNLFDKLRCFNRVELAIRTLDKGWRREQLLANRQELVTILASIDARLGEKNEDATEG